MTGIHQELGCTQCNCQRPMTAGLAPSALLGRGRPWADPARAVGRRPYQPPRFRVSQKLYGAQHLTNHYRLLQITALLHEASTDLVGALEALGRVMDRALDRTGLMNREGVEHGTGAAG